MSDTPQETPRSGFTLDLSSGAAGKPKRVKGFVPVVQKTINLSTKKADPAAEPAAPQPARSEPARSLRRSGADRTEPAQTEPARHEPTRSEPARTSRPDSRRDAPRRSGQKQTDAHRPDARRRDEPRPSVGTSLADLLDEATLARLRGK